jgi:hypothetical protein
MATFLMILTIVRECSFKSFLVEKRSMGAAATVPWSQTQRPIVLDNEN